MLYSSGTTGRPKGIRRPLPTQNGSWGRRCWKRRVDTKDERRQHLSFAGAAVPRRAVNYTMAIHRIGAASCDGQFDAERAAR